MIRKLLLPALLALAGCATGYDYRAVGAAGDGDYYYGQPSVDYEDDGFYGPGGGMGYGYPGGWSGMIGYGMGFGGGYGPYGYGYPYFAPYGYGDPYFPRPRVIVVRPDPLPPSGRRPGLRGLPGVAPSVPPDRRPLLGQRGIRPLGEVSPPPRRLLLDRPQPMRFERAQSRSNSMDAPVRGHRDRDEGLRPHP